MNLPLVSAIITTRNSSCYCGKCFLSVQNQSYTNIEMIVVDNNSHDTTKDTALEYTDKVFNHGPERSAQRNFGVQQASGEYVFFIDSDMILSKDVIHACVERMKINDKIKGCVIPEQSFGIGFWAQCKQLERSFYIGVEWMEAARFFARKTFNEFGGYNENNTGTEDYDLPQRIQSKYGQGSIGRVAEFIYHDEGTISLLKTCRKKFYYAQNLAVYRQTEANKNNYQKQSSLLGRYKLFLSHPGILFKNPLIGFGMLFMKTCEFCSGALGLYWRP